MASTSDLDPRIPGTGPRGRWRSPPAGSAISAPCQIEQPAETKNAHGAIYRFGRAGVKLRGDSDCPKELQGRGCGQDLYEQIVQRANSIGVREIILLTETAAPFFAKQGFAAIPRDEVDVIVKTSVEFRSSCPASAVCMRLDLAQDEGTGAIRRPPDSGRMS